MGRFRVGFRTHNSELHSRRCKVSMRNNKSNGHSTNAHLRVLTPPLARSSFKASFGADAALSTSLVSPELLALPFVSFGCPLDGPFASWGVCFSFDSAALSDADLQSHLILIRLCLVIGGPHSAEQDSCSKKRLAAFA